MADKKTDKIESSIPNPNYKFHDVSDGIGGADSHSGKTTRNENANGFMINFYHIPTGETCHFKAFLTAFEDVYDSQWNEEEVYGRMDPISTFKRTRRRIRLGWDVPAASEEEAILNLKESEKFVSMLYPVYEEYDAGNYAKNGSTGKVTESGTQRRVGVMASPPLFKIKFANLIMDAEVGEVGGKGVEAVKTSGLVGAISGLSYRPDIEQGFFGGFSGVDPFSGKELDRNIVAGTLIPQTISFDIEITVHHQHGMGFSLSSLKKERRESRDQKNRTHLNGRRANGFPYSTNKILRSNN